MCAIDLRAIAHNAGEVRRVVGRNVQICAVVKADAYGHGAVPVARTLVAAGCERLAVATLDEARELRAAGIASPLAILGNVEPRDAAECIDQCLTVTVSSLEHARALSAALTPPARLLVQLKIDTGMHRAGAPASRLGELARGLAALPLEVESVLSHLACADVPGDPSVPRQLAEFHRVLGELAAAGREPRLRHLANSAGLLLGSEYHFDMVRPGIMLYGGLPHEKFGSRVALRPAMTLRTRIVQLKDLPRGAGIGYGHRFHTERPSKIALLPLGYADGYLRALSNRGVVLVRGQRAPVVGIVSMDYITVDVTHIPDVRVEDDALLWGQWKGERLDVMEVAASAGTIGYELMVRVGRRPARVWLGD